MGKWGGLALNRHTLTASSSLFAFFFGSEDLPEGAAVLQREQSADCSSGKLRFSFSENNFKTNYIKQIEKKNICILTSGLPPTKRSI